MGTTVAGSTSDPGPWSYQLNNPTAITFDPYGYMYILDTGNARVQKWAVGAAFGSTVASASMSNPYGLRFDQRGNMVIADTSNQRLLFFGLTCRELIERKRIDRRHLFSFRYSSGIYHYHDIATQ